MSTAIAKNFQIGADGTASNNFTLYQPATPDGTLRLGNGNTGITSSLLTLSSAGQLSLVAGSASAPTLSPSGDSNTGIFFPAADTIAFAEGGVEAMRLDAAGNLGLGVTPSAWGSGWKVAQFGTGASISSFGAYTFIGQNWYNDGANVRYIANGFATYHQQQGGIHSWHTAPSGTAGNAITFTQAMTLDASGNLALGKTSTSYRLGLQVANSVSNVSAFEATNANNASFEVFLRQDVTTVCAGGVGNLVFATGAVTERARITSGGELLVGLTAPLSGERLSVSGATGNVEAARITHNGNYSGLQVNATAAAFADNIILANSTRAASNAFQFFRAVANGANQFRVAGDGVIYAQNTTVQSISDQRLKENIQNATDGLGVITALRPVRYDWKQGYGNDRKNQLGFIAQEVEAVFPEAVSEWQVNENDETAYKTVGPGAFIPVLVKAIQEQQAIINQLKADVAALKGA